MERASRNTKGSVAIVRRQKDRKDIFEVCLGTRSRQLHKVWSPIAEICKGKSVADEESSCSGALRDLRNDVVELVSSGKLFVDVAVSAALLELLNGVAVASEEPFGGEESLHSDGATCVDAAGADADFGACERVGKKLDTHRVRSDSRRRSGSTRCGRRRRCPCGEGRTPQSPLNQPIRFLRSAFSTNDLM